MRALLPERSATVDVHDYYAADWLDAGGVRVNFVSSVDGAVAVSGTSGGLQTAGDNTVFGALRDLADVIVAGSGTVVGEGYKPVSLTASRREVRHQYGLTAVPPIGVISRSLKLDPAAALFAPAEARTLVLTCAAADAEARARLAEVAEVIVCGQDDIEPSLVRTALAQRGLTRVLCEGGPSVFAAWARTDAIDELCLSISPLLAGPGAGRITAGAQWSGPRALRLHGLLEQDGALFARYRRA